MYAERFHCALHSIFVNLSRPFLPFVYSRFKFFDDKSSSILRRIRSYFGNYIKREVVFTGLFLYYQMSWRLFAVC
jgi:hypothetical protein